MAFEAYAPNRVISAREFYVTVTGEQDNLPPGYEAYCHYLTGWEMLDANGASVPITVAYSYQNGAQPAYEGQDGYGWVPGMPSQIAVKLGAEGQAPGACTFRFTLTSIGSTEALSDGITQTIDMPVFIAQTPLVVSCDSGHPIPGLDEYDHHMIELADKWQTELLKPDNGLGENNWYYDVTSTYQMIGAYLHNAMRYWDVAYSSACRYRDYLIESNGQPAPWKVFPRGLRQMYQSTHDRQWIDAIKSMTTSGWVGCAGSTDPELMRESAYATAVWLELEWLDAGDPTKLERGITCLLGQFNLFCAQQFGKGKGVACEPFIFGLSMQTLIDYYDLVADPRIPQALMATCAWLWENAVDAKTGYVLYDVWEPGGVDGGNAVAYTSLNGLMVNGWGFLYNVTGDDLWRRQGDILFEHMFNDNEWGWSAKQFAQIYWRSTDYVTRWRA